MLLCFAGGFGGLALAGLRSSGFRQQPVWQRSRRARAANAARLSTPDTRCRETCPPSLPPLQVRKLLNERRDPSWSFTTLYLVKDSFALMLEGAGLWEDAFQVRV